MSKTLQGHLQLLANMQFRINSFRPLFPDKIFSLTIPGLLVKFLTLH